MIKTNEKFNINYIDASSYCKFNRCPAMYFFERQVGLRLPDAMTIALDYGTDMHFAFPHAYADPELALSCFVARWSKRSYGNEDAKRNVGRAHASLKEFHNCRNEHACPYKVEDFNLEATTADKISNIEVPFIIDIGGPLALAGRIDAPVKWLDDDTWWALDYKTASEISARYFKSFENAPQSVAYTLALAHLTGKHVSGMIIEAVRSSKAKVETSLQLVFVSEVQVKNFIENANNTAEEILFCNEDKMWPQKSSGCSPYSMFGTVGYPCPYLELCNSTDWEAASRFYEKIKPFHPFEVAVL